jgi:hypothetical protein
MATLQAARRNDKGGSGPIDNIVCTTYKYERQSATMGLLGNEGA